MKETVYLCPNGCEELYRSTEKMAEHLIEDHETCDVTKWGIPYDMLESFRHKQSTVMAEFPRQVTMEMKLGKRN